MHPSLSYPSRFQEQLNSYLLAAAAAGVSVLSLSPAALAEIVFTPANVQLPGTGSYGIDLNHDGVTDISIVTTNTLTGDSTLRFRMTVSAPVGNGVVGKLGAKALYAGSIVGRNRAFNGVTMGTGFLVAGSPLGTHGYWTDKANRFLGVKFLIDGETHYGWVRLTVAKALITTLTGYAYETVPNRPTLAGLKHYPAQGELIPNSLNSPSSDPQPTLGLLALGSGGLAIWRRENVRAASP